MRRKIGVILARFQPIHNGHIALLTKAVSENSEVHIFIGSANKLDNRNPIPIGLRKQMIYQTLKDLGFTTLCTVVELDDLDSENNNSFEWGFYLYANIVRSTQQDDFTMYYSDGFEIITKWFPGFILRNHVSLSLLARNRTEKGLSATEVRQLILNDGDLTDKVPNIVIENRDLIKTFILLNP